MVLGTAVIVFPLVYLAIVECPLSSAFVVTVNIIENYMY
jgi:hypothetical protein